MSSHINSQNLINGGTPIYFDPTKRKVWDRRLKITKLPPQQEIASDAFSFGISIIELGNLLNLKYIELNKDVDLL